MNGLRLENMEARDMLDVLHYFFEEDVFYSTAEQADGRDRARQAIYRDFYNSHYAYAFNRSDQVGQGVSRNFDNIEIEEEITPFDPLQKQKPTKPFISPTQVNASSPLPFGDALDGPLTR